MLVPDLLSTPMVSRGSDPRWFAQARPLAATFGATFVRTYERGERVALAMAARGYGGTMARSARIAATGRQWAAAALLVGLVWLIATVGWALQ